MTRPVLLLALALGARGVAAQHVVATAPDTVVVATDTVVRMRPMSAAWRSEMGRLGGGSVAYPIPRGPCVSGVTSSGRTSGTVRPSATSMSVRPTNSRTARVFSATWRASTLPDTHETATISASGEAQARRRARLSSIPVSTSMINGIRSVTPRW